MGMIHIQPRLRADHPNPVPWRAGRGSDNPRGARPPACCSSSPAWPTRTGPPSDREEAPWLLHAPQGHSTRPEADEEAPAVQVEPIVNGCAWLRHCRDDAATLVEPKWYAMLSIFGRCEEGDNQAHEWSRPYPGYTPEETAAKLAHALGAGPRTYANVATLSDNRYCRNCPSWGKIKIPIAPGDIRQQASGTFGMPHAQDSGDSEECPVPLALPEPLVAVEPFEPKLLPEAFRPWIEDIAERMLCPPDYPAVAVMIAQAAVVGRRVRIRPKRQDDWLVVVNL
jgi:hypothetical protein